MNSKSGLFIVALVSMVLVVCKGAPWSSGLENGIDSRPNLRDGQPPTPSLPVDPDTSNVIEEVEESESGDEGEDEDAEINDNSIGDGYVDDEYDEDYFIEEYYDEDEEEDNEDLGEWVDDFQYGEDKQTQN